MIAQLDLEHSVHKILKNQGAGKRWLPGKIVQVTGAVSFLVELQAGREKQCHLDQLRSQESGDDTHIESEVVEEDTILINWLRMLN